VGDTEAGRGSLRQRKRLRVRDQIVEAATGLFESRGVESVRMAQIAQRAEVSEATLYNYFANKSALAEIWARQRLGRVLAEAAAGSGRGASRRTGRAMARAVAEAAVGGRGWLEPVWGPCGRGAPRPAIRPAPDALVDLFRTAQEAGDVRADVAAEELAELLWLAIEGRIRTWLADDPGASDAEALAAPVRRAAEVVLDGCQKRHERVRAPAATRAVAPAT
jgi:AcrR family transcriptional regulator